AAAAGTRVFTATSSAGLALMHEMLHYYAGSRLPGVIAVVNRSIGAPLNILCDHSTIMAQRDTGWLQAFAANVQEAYHFHILASRWSEACSLPLMVSMDGFELSHITERLEVLPTSAVKEFIGEWEPELSLATDDDLVVAYPGIAGSDYYSEIKESQMEGMRAAETLFERISSELAMVTGTKLNVVEEYSLGDAEIALVVIGSASGTIRDKIKDMRSRGVKAGMLVIKVFRPFPQEKVREALKGKQVVGVMERVPVLGSNIGPLAMDVTQSLYDLAESQRPRIANFIFGLGGRSISMDTIGKALNILDTIRSHSSTSQYRRVYHLDVRDSRKDVLLSAEQIDAIYYQPVKKMNFDIRMFARGGEGIKTASKFLASTVIEKGGKHAQGFSVYGAERSGAPTQGYVRIGDEVINERSPIIYSDIDIFANPGLFDAQAIQGLREDGIILINSSRTPEEIRRDFGIKGRRIFTVDSYRIAQEEIGDRRWNNMAMLAALVGVTEGILDIHDLLKNIGKLPYGIKIIEANKRAAARAFFEWRGEEQESPEHQLINEILEGVK
ncbi:MAG: 2-oxoacid:acceptor oxidoreductase family protein, partial [Anaerolineaceae bacterium]|nr:2-oxoacid:acceptor oxidoreductase family protein [Anaerolineaceae bacterium]